MTDLLQPSVFTEIDLRRTRPSVTLYRATATDPDAIHSSAGSAITKRACDVVVGGLLALAALPAIVFMAAVVAVTLRTTKPFFQQERVGKDGKLFRFIKLRTLPPTAPAYASKYTINEIPIPWFCRLLRATHLDELPQLFLVLAGKMSLVGPRPEMEAMHVEGDPFFAYARTSVRPGCTGLWQTSVDKARMIWEAPEWDLYYLRHQSLWLDLKIMVKTALVTLGVSRPVEPADFFG